MDERDLPLVSVLLPTWNTKAYVEAFLQSLLSQDYHLNFIEVVIVDNASSDGTLQSLLRWQKGHSPGIRRITVEHFDVNRGIAAAYNRAFELTDPASEILVRAESDVVWDPHVLTQLVHGFRTNPRIGVVGARGLLFDDPLRVEHAARKVNWWTGRVSNTDPGCLRECDAVLGSTFGIRRLAVSAWPALFPTDRFFADELGFCVRIRRQGYGVVCQPAARVFHRSAGSTGQLHPQRFVFVDVFERALLHLELNPLRSRWCALSLMAARALYHRDAVTLRAILAACVFSWSGRPPVPGKSDLGQRFARWVAVDSAVEALPVDFSGGATQRYDGECGFRSWRW